MSWIDLVRADVADGEPVARSGDLQGCDPRPPGGLGVEADPGEVRAVIEGRGHRVLVVRSAPDEGRRMAVNHQEPAPTAAPVEELLPDPGPVKPARAAAGLRQVAVRILERLEAGVDEQKVAAAQMARRALDELEERPRQRRADPLEGPAAVLDVDPRAGIDLLQNGVAAVMEPELEIVDVAQGVEQHQLVVARQEGALIGGGQASGLEDKLHRSHALRAAVDDVAEKDDAPPRQQAGGRRDMREHERERLGLAVHVADGEDLLVVRRPKGREARPGRLDDGVGHVRRSLVSPEGGAWKLLVRFLGTRLTGPPNTWFPAAQFKVGAIRRPRPGQ